MIVGNYSYYDDPIDPEGFERNVLYHYGHDCLIIGKFCAIATHVKFIMNGANDIEKITRNIHPIMEDDIKALKHCE
jgi:acetyltransferase-like isoleucine patch superfamily enzyme